MNSLLNLNKISLPKNALVALASIAASLAFIAASPGADSLQPQETLPSGAEVIQRVLLRSAALAAATNKAPWAYDKLQVALQLDSDGKVEERTEKLYRVHIVRGVPFSRLIKVGGRELTAAELEKENQHEAAFQKGLSGRDPKKSLRDREALITTNIINRFQFKVLRRDLVHGHLAIVVNFEAKPGKSGGDMQDRLLNQMAGTLWVDEQTADVARLEVRLTKSVSIGVLGMLGTIKDCQMEMSSVPMTDGTWLPEKTALSFSARMFLSGMRMKMEETSTNFSLEPASAVPLP